MPIDRLPDEEGTEGQDGVYGTPIDAPVDPVPTPTDIAPEGSIPPGVATVPDQDGTDADGGPAGLPGDPGVPQVRPWVRFLARGIDINIWLILLGAVYGALDPLLPDVPWIAVTMVGLLVYNLLEAASFALYGTTPGKWLLRVYVRTATGDRLGFGRALGRAFAVYIKGYALGIPIINLVAMGAAFARLSEEKTTDWDREGRFRVTHGRVGVLRSLFVALLVVGYLALSVAGYLMERSGAV